MANTRRRDNEPTRSRRVRGALAPLSRASAAATACILWVGLALPGLQLLPGASGFGDRSIAISLQSALLGIDNGYAATPEVRAAMRALGLAVLSESPGPRLQTDSPVSLAVDLAESIRADTVDTTVTPTLISDGPHHRPTTGTDAPAGTPPSHEQPDAPLAPAEPNAPTPPPGGVTPPKPPKPPSAPTKSAQSISFSTSPWAAVVGGSYAVGASASSGLPVSFSLAPGSSGVCTISGATVRFVGTGTCTVRANQSGNASYLAAPQVTQSVDVDDAVAVQTISFLSTPPSGAHIHDPPYNVNAKATSGLPVELGTEDGSAGICKVTGANVHLIGEGTLHDHRDPARQQQVPAGASGAAVVLDRHGRRLAECPVDQLHVDAANRAGRRRDLRRCGDGELRADGGFFGRAVQRGRVHRRRLDGLARRDRNLHRPGEPGGQRELPRGAAGAARVPGRPRRPDDHVLEHAALGRCGRRSGLHRDGDVLVRPPRRLQREPEQRLGLHRFRLDCLVDGFRDLHGRR